ncbi:MAG: nucleotidyltransferase family protein [Candidatus Acidiferrales bacterium]
MTPASKRAPCGEKQLLVCCARTRLTPEGADKVRGIVAGPLDWDYLLWEAEENSITPLLERHLSAIAPGAAPPAAQEQLKRTSRANTVRCLYLTAELIHILRLFESREIPSIPYKGPVLAAQAYGDIALREFEDLDIILRQSDLPNAHEVISSLGYKPKYDWILSPGASASLVPGEYNYRDEARRAMVELHTEITLRHFPVKPDLDDFMRKRAPVRVGERDVLTFAAEDSLPMLCIHGSKDFWERLSWIADVSELIRSHPALDWDRVARLAESLHATRMLHVGLALAALVIGAPLLPEVAARVSADRVAGQLAVEVHERLMSRPFQTLDAVGRLQFRRRMVAGYFDGWRYTLRLAVVPSEDDWQLVRLPHALAPLYVALRPLRLLQKYGRAGRRPNTEIKRT